MLAPRRYWLIYLGHWVKIIPPPDPRLVSNSTKTLAGLELVLMVVGLVKAEPVSKIKTYVNWRRCVMCENLEAIEIVKGGSGES